MKTRLPSLNNEHGFVLAVSIILLAICTMIGIAATMTSTSEIEINTNDLIYRETLYGTEAGASVAMEALLEKEAQFSWADGEFMDTDNRVQIVDGDFLTEGDDSDGALRWRCWERFQESPSIDRKPVDDLRVTGSNDSVPYATDTNPDIRVRMPGQFVVDIDVDKVRSKHIAGSGAEFGTGAEGLFGVKVIYNFDCIGTLPGRSLTEDRAPINEVLVGYRYVPSGM